MYNGTIEIRFDSEPHLYYRVGELGNLIPLHNVTTILKKAINASEQLVPWGAKMVVEKMLRLIPLKGADEFGSPLLAPLTLEEFTKLAMEAKTAPKDRLEEAGNIGKIAHGCLEDSIQFALDHDAEKIVRALRSLPEDEKAKACAEAALSWMQQHNVRWLKTEQKVYSKKYEYVGTMDGLATVDACEDRTCCPAPFKDRLSLIDWKSSNALRIDYLFQTASYVYAEQEEHGILIEDRWVLRLGKDAEEAGRFEPWHETKEDLEQDFQGFLTCFELVKLMEAVNERMSTKKRGVREAKKLQREAQKAMDKAAAKAKREAEKAQLKLDRAAEKERIKVDAKKAREAKNAKVSKTPVLDTVRPTVTVGITEPGTDSVGTDKGSPEGVVSPVADYPEMTEQVRGILEEAKVERKPFVIAEEG